VEIFNTREIAVGIWIAVIFVTAIFWEESRSLIIKFIKLFFKRALFSPFILMTLYIALVVYHLEMFGFWEPHQTKNTFVWFFLVELTTFFRLDNISRNPSYFKTALKDNIKIVMVVQFLVSLYTFHLAIEIVVFPIICIAVMILDIAKRDLKLKIVERLFTAIIGCYGIFLVLYSIYKLFTSFDEIAKRQTLYDFATPILLSTLLLPLIYFFSIVMNYEIAFFRLRYLIKDTLLLKYTKFKAFYNFGLKTKVLKRWIDSLMSKELTNKTQIDLSIKELRDTLNLEAAPPIVQLSDGWSPYLAKDFLDSEGLGTEYYRLYEGEIGQASSPYVDIGDGSTLNVIAYYVNGEADIAKKLKLVLDVHEVHQYVEAHSKLLSSAKKLHKVALGTSLPNNLTQAIINGKNLTTRFQGRIKVAVSKIDWPSERGYNLNFLIEIEA